VIGGRSIGKGPVSRVSGVSGCWSRGSPTRRPSPARAGRFLARRKRPGQGACQWICQNDSQFSSPLLAFAGIAATAAVAGCAAVISTGGNSRHEQRRRVRRMDARDCAQLLPVTELMSGANHPCRECTADIPDGWSRRDSSDEAARGVGSPTQATDSTRARQACGGQRCQRTTWGWPVNE